MPFASSMVVATDLSPASRPALAEAARIARDTGSHVTLLFVLDVSPWVLPPNVTNPESTMRRIVEEATGAAHSVLASFREAYFSGIPEVNVKIAEHPSAAHAICDSARSWGADLIVVASHGRSGPSSAVIGSVTEKVVRAAMCRVLVVPSRDAHETSH